MHMQSKRNVPLWDGSVYPDSHRLSNKTPTLDRSLPLSCWSWLHGCPTDSKNILGN